MSCPFSALWQTVTGKNIKAPHPVAENNTEEPASPSRRSLLMGLGAPVAHWLLAALPVKLRWLRLIRPRFCPMMPSSKNKLFMVNIKAGSPPRSKRR